MSSGDPLVDTNVNGVYTCVASNLAGTVSYSKRITTNWFEIFVHNAFGKFVVLASGVASILFFVLLSAVFYFYKRQRVRPRLSYKYN